MYIIYSGSAGQYASAAVSKRDGAKTSITYTYLGTVLDREKGIYHNKERGIFAFDPTTGQYNEGKRQSQHTYSWNQQSEKIILNNKEHGSEQDDTSSETSRVGTTTVRL